MNLSTGAVVSMIAVVLAGVVAWFSADQMLERGAMQDIEGTVVRPELIAAMPREVRESSGVVISDRDPVLWTHNDSGDGAFLYAVDTTGSVVGRARLRGVRARDFEDLGKGPCPTRWSDEPYCLYVADTGNNDRGRNTLSVYVLPEPELSEEPVSVESARLRFRYPDQRSDVEALAVSPEGDLWLVSKGRHDDIRGYRIAAEEVEQGLDAEERADVTFLGTLPLQASARLRRLVTGGTFARNGELLVVRTYEGIYGYTYSDDSWTAAGVCTLRPREPGGEAIAWEGGDRFILTSEAGSSRYPSIHRATCPLG